MNHSITIRDLAGSERKRLKRSGTGVVSMFLLPIIPGGGILIVVLFGVAGFFWILEKIGLQVGQSTRLYIFVGAIVVGSIAGFCAALSLFRSLWKARLREKHGLKHAKVEIIAVENPVVVQQEEHNDEGPIYYLDIGQGKLLFLCGQWMFDSQTYDSAPVSDSEDDENWPPFPSDAFVIHRIPESGTVLKIDIKGQKLSPVRTIKIKDVPLRDVSDSMVIEGSLDDLKSAMTNASQRRKRKGNKSA